MTKYLPSICAHCRRTLRVRSAYLGRMVTCNHCDHPFLAEESPANRSVSIDRRNARDRSGRTLRRLVRPSQWATETRPEVERLQDPIIGLAAAPRLGGRRRGGTRIQPQRERAARDDAPGPQDRALRACDRGRSASAVLREDLITVRAELDQFERDLKASREEFEAESRSSASRIESLEGELAAMRNERNRAHARLDVFRPNTTAAWSVTASGNGHSGKASAATVARSTSWLKSCALQALRPPSPLSASMRSPNNGRSHSGTRRLEAALAPGDPGTLQKTVAALGEELDAIRTERDRLADQCLEADPAFRSIEDEHRDQREFAPVRTPGSQAVGGDCRRARNGAARADPRPPQRTRHVRAKIRRPAPRTAGGIHGTGSRARSHVPPATGGRMPPQGRAPEAV